MTLKYVSAASSTGRRKLGVNYIAAVNSSELKLTMLQRPFHGAPASACNPSVFINPGLSEAASGLATTLFVEPVPPKCQPTCEFLSYTISRKIDTCSIRQDILHQIKLNLRRRNNECTQHIRWFRFRKYP